MSETSLDTTAAAGSESSHAARERPSTGGPSGRPGASTPAAPDAGRRRSRRRVGVGVAMAVALGAGGWMYVTTRALSPSPSTSSTDAAATATATVTRRDLVEQTTVDGTLAYGDATGLYGPAGTVTATFPVGTVVSQGQSVIEVDGHQIPLLYGTVPLWRELSGGSGDGADIAMLEQNLEAMGYGDGLVLTVDAHWDDATRIAVQRWQKAVGHEQTGTVRPGDAVVHDGPARIATLKAVTGQPAPPNAPLVEVTGTSRSVQAEIKASQQALVHQGDPVDVVLPDQTTVGGHITKVGNVASSAADDGNGNGGGGDTTDAKLEVDIALDDESKLGTLDQAPVSVELTTSAAKDVIAVPVTALLALREGGYAVEVAKPNGNVLVGVHPRAFADGWVQVDGDLTEGEHVVVPR